MKYKSLASICFAASTLALASAAANATPSGSLLFEQAPVAGGSSTGSDNGLEATAGDDFTVSTTSTLTGLVWYGNNLLSDPASTADNFEVGIADITAGVNNRTPVFGAALTVTKTDAGFTDSDGVEVFKYEADFIGPILEVGKVYGISIANDLAFDTSGDFWLWSALPGGTSYYADSTTGVNPDGSTAFAVNPDVGVGNLAFSVYGVTGTPEPASLGILGLGLAGLAARRRRR